MNTVLTIAIAGTVLAQCDQLDIPDVEELTVDAASQQLPILPAICTAYAPTGQRTATGIWPTWGIVATDPSMLPMGTRMLIDGFGDQVFVAADRGGGVRGWHVDIFYPTYAQAVAFGRRPCSVTVLR